MNTLRIAFRFDDVCPTMKWGIWDRIEALFDAHGVQPMLGVVPDNQDPKLIFDPPNPSFWDRARRWQEKGWIIGLHGYRHLYDSKDGGLVPWWRQSEFAGIPYEVQLERITKGMEILRGRGLVPRVWIAPAHSFDENTLRALKTVGVNIISDGWNYAAYRCHREMIWVPAQPWRPRFWKWGFWTEVFHANGLSDTAPIEQLLKVHEGRIMGRAFDFDEVIKARRKTAADLLFEHVYASVFKVVRLPQQYKRNRRRQGALAIPSH